VGVGCILFLVVLGFELSFTLVKQVLYLLSHSTALFCVGYFQDRVLRIICMGWLQIAVLISAS
jgi:hypothetical protein